MDHGFSERIIKISTTATAHITPSRNAIFGLGILVVCIIFGIGLFFGFAFARIDARYWEEQYQASVEMMKQRADKCSIPTISD